MTHSHSQTRSARQDGVERGGMGAVKRVMISSVGTIDQHVTSATGYEEMQQRGGREGASIELFDQWLNACESSSILPCIY